MQQAMTDRDLMEELLLTAKNACDLYVHGAMEASTPQVRETFSRALNESLVMQDDIYNAMADRGWYPAQQAQQQQISQVRQQFETRQ